MPQHKIYNKLVRDRIPEIIQAEGRECAVETMNEADYVQALLEKVVEEAQEIASAPDDQLAIEIADLYEVLDSLLAFKGIDEAHLREVQRQRREARGGFVKRIKLLWAEA